MKRQMVRVVLGAAVAAGLVGVAGCGGKPKQVQDAVQAQVPIAEQAQEPAATKPAPPAEDSANILAAKTQDYVREMTPAVNAAAPRGAEPSVAQFMDPDALRIGPSASRATVTKQAPEPPVQVVPIENPVVAATPSLPNQGASIAANEGAVATAAAADGANVPKLVATSVAERRPAAAAAAAPGGAASELEAQVNKNLRDHPKDLWAQLDYQLLQFVKDKPTPQLEVMAKLSSEDRELITAVMDGLTNFRNAVRADNNMLVSRKVGPILDLANRVRAQADLTIPALALCTRVDGFGVYEPVEPARFQAMREHPIIVYCEVQNFASQVNEKKMWETRLAQEVVLYTETGLPVWQDKTENIPDQARQRRHDFFVVKKTKFPANITIGRYLLKVTIVDQQASRVAEATIPVQFVAQ